MTADYGQLVGEAVQRIAKDGDLSSSLSAPARAALGCFSEAIATSLSKSIESVVLSSFSASSKNASVDTAMDVTQAALVIARDVGGRVASQLGVSFDVAKGVSDVAGGIADIIPILGTVVGWILNAGSASEHGIGPMSSSTAERAEWCRNATYFALSGKGAGLAAMPADIFVRPTDGYGLVDAFGIPVVAGINAYGEQGMSSLGQHLVLMGEPDSVDVYDSAGTVVGNCGIASTRARLTKLAQAVGKTGPQLFPWAFTGQVGMPKSLQSAFRQLRLAIASLWGPTMRAKGKLTDGGASLMPIYTDLLRIAWTRGWMNPTYWEYLSRTYSEKLLSVADGGAGDTCYDHEKRGSQAAYALVQGWEQTVHPFDAVPAGSVDALVDLARELAEEKVRVRIHLGSPGLASQRLMLLAQAIADWQRSLTPAGQKPRIRIQL